MRFGVQILSIHINAASKGKDRDIQSKLLTGLVTKLLSSGVKWLQYTWHRHQPLSHMCMYTQAYVCAHEHANMCLHTCKKRIKRKKRKKIWRERKRRREKRRKTSKRCKTLAHKKRGLEITFWRWAGEILWVSKLPVTVSSS